MPRTLDRRILRITGQSGEWFVDLKAGFAFRDANTVNAQHGFGEDTKADIRRSMTTVTKCQCGECSTLLAAGRDE